MSLTLFVSRIRAVSAAFVFLLAFALYAAAQTPTPTPLPSPTPKPDKNAGQNLTAEQIAESVIIVYAFPGGRPVLEQIRKTTFERGKTTVLNGEGRMESANYQKWAMRGTNLDKAKIRLDQEFPTVRYSLVQSEEKVFGIFNESVFTPREDAAKNFQNQIHHSLDGLLRYKENESKLDLVGRDKIMGVDYHVIDVTDKQGRKTRYYVSSKRFRVIMLEYEAEGKKFRRKFYDYNYAQGTLVPFRSVLYEGDKVIEETQIGTVTFGQRVDEGLFAQS